MQEKAAGVHTDAYIRTYDRDYDDEHGDEKSADNHELRGCQGSLEDDRFDDFSQNLSLFPFALNHADSCCEDDFVEAGGFDGVGRTRGEGRRKRRGSRKRQAGGCGRC